MRGRALATAAAPLSPMVLLLRLEYHTTNTHMWLWFEINLVIVHGSTDNPIVTSVSAMCCWIQEPLSEPHLLQVQSHSGPDCSWNVLHLLTCTLCKTYFRISNELLCLRALATAAAPLSPIVLWLRLQFCNDATNMYMYVWVYTENLHQKVLI